MERLQGTMHVARHVAIATLVGFLAILLAGPLLTVAGVILPFALVGALLYVPYQVFVAKKQINFRAGGAFLGTILAIPFLMVGGVFRGIAWVLARIWGLVTFVLGIVLPMLAGGFLGGVLGAIGGIEHQDPELRIPAGILIGAGVGLIAGLWPREKAKVVKVYVQQPQMAPVGKPAVSV